MILSDIELRQLSLCPVVHGGKPLITPYSEAQESKVISFGLSSSGYDVRLGRKAKIFDAPAGWIIDPKKFSDPEYVDDMMASVESNDHFILQPHGYGLFLAMEWVNMPRNMMGLCLGKSTYARCGAHVNATPMESEWAGHLVIEISNPTKNPLKLYVGEGIAQFLFLRTGPVERSYADKGGKYQNQTEVTVARIKS